MENGFWVLSKHADIVAAGKDTEVFSSHLGGPILWDANEIGILFHRSGMMGMDRPEHTRYRKLVSGGFTPKGLQALEPIVRRRATGVVDAIAARCTEVETGARNVDHILRSSLTPLIARGILEKMAEDLEPTGIEVSIAPSGEWRVDVDAE